MKPRLLVQHVSLFLSVGCLVTGYISAGFWQIVPISLLLILYWASFRQRSGFTSSSAVFVGFVVMTAAGIVLDLSRYLMLIALTAALTYWDLARFNKDLRNVPTRRVDSRMESHHFRSLGLAVTASLILSLLASTFEFQLEFGITVLLVLTALGGLIVTIRNLAKIGDLTK